MAYLWKLLYKFKYPIRYVTFALLFLFLFMLVHICSIRFNVEYKEILPGFQVFSYNGAKLSYVAPKHILLWDNYYLIMNNSEQMFPNLQCRVNNCIFTKNKDLLDGDYTRFDALIFTEAILNSKVRPEKRAESQIYIFTTIESAYNHPACELYNDNFFNWTFTYRLDSDLLWNYFVVRNASEDTIAPSINANWKPNIDKIAPSSILKILDGKTKAAAWLVSHCNADNSRNDYVTRLQEHLYHFSLKVDVYGACSKTKCINDNCEEMFTRDYYFYLAFENSFSEDYVTEKVLHGYKNYVVPIVYGGANYSRFLPPGSYLNARELHPYNLAVIIHEAIQNPVKYREYFKWTNVYTIDDGLVGYHPLCKLCEALNSKKARQKQTYGTFRIWWNGQNGMKWCLPAQYWNETSRINVDAGHIFNMYYS